MIEPLVDAAHADFYVLTDDGQQSLKQGLHSARPHYMPPLPLGSVHFFSPDNVLAHDLETHVFDPMGMRGMGHTGFVHHRSLSPPSILQRLSSCPLTLKR